MLRAVGLVKSYGEVHALRGVDLDVRRGEIVGLLGPNGAGKTTLVSIVAGLRRPDAGTVTVDGIDVLTHPHRARLRLGLAPQDTGVYPVVTVRNNLKLFGEIAGLRGSTLNRRIGDVAESLDIVDLLDRKAGNLSGGQKRRLHTAIALLHEPPLLLLDEATTGTDVATRKHLLELIGRLAAAGAAVLYSTHYLHEVEELGARVAIIEEGQVIARGAFTEMIAKHGGAAVELAFDGPPPDLGTDERVLVDGNVVRVLTDDAPATAARILASLGTATQRLMGIEIIRPSLETVYLALTGRRYEDTEEETEDVATA